MDYTQNNRLVVPTNVNLDRHRQRKIVFYGRVSTEHEAQLSALENQLQWYDDQLRYHSNWTVLRKYIDEGITGTQAKKRPAFMEMIADAKQRKFDLIVTREVCRFARNTVDTLMITRELKDYGVEVYFVEDNIWTMDNDGELRLSLMATLAQEESRKTSERVRAGQKISRDKGVLYGNGNIIGYDRVGGTYVKNPEQAETVLMIFQMYAKGLGQKKICNELCRLQRKDGVGKVSWSATKISRIIRNATYKGYKGYLKSYRNNHLEQKSIRNLDERTHLYIKGDFEPIVSEELWDYCNSLRKKKSQYLVNEDGSLKTVGQKTTNDVFLHKLRCNCGSKFRKNRWHQRKDGSWSYGYRCYNVLNNGSKSSRIKDGNDAEGYCDGPMICDWKFEIMASRLIKDLWKDRKEAIIESLEIFNRNYVVEKKYTKEEIAGMEAKLYKVKQRLNNLTCMRADGEISKEEYQEMRAEAEKSIQEYENWLTEATQTDILDTREVFDISQVRNRLEELVDFQTDKIPHEIIEKFVALIVPIDGNHFDWFLTLDEGVYQQEFCTLEGRKNTLALDVKTVDFDDEMLPKYFHNQYFEMVENMAKNPFQSGVLHRQTLKIRENSAIKLPKQSMKRLIR